MRFAFSVCNFAVEGAEYVDRYSFYIIYSFKIIAAKFSYFMFNFSLDFVFDVCIRFYANKTSLHGNRCLLFVVFFSLYLSLPFSIALAKSNKFNTRKMVSKLGFYIWVSLHFNQNYMNIAHEYVLHISYYEYNLNFHQFTLLLFTSSTDVYIVFKIHLKSDRWNEKRAF